MRVSSFNSVPVAINSTVNESYDIIVEVSKHLEAIDEIKAAIDSGIDFEYLSKALKALGASVGDSLAKLNTIDLEAISDDLRKGSYLGARKLDIQLDINIPEITLDVIENDIANNTTIANDIRTSLGNNIPSYDKAIITFNDGEVVELPFINDDGIAMPVSTTTGLHHQFTRMDTVPSQKQVEKITDIVPVNNTIYTIILNGIEYSYVSDSNATVEDIVTSFNQLFGLDLPVDVTVINNELIFEAKTAGVPFSLNVKSYMQVVEGVFDVSLVAILPKSNAAYKIEVIVEGVAETHTYYSSSAATLSEITNGIVSEINNSSNIVRASTDGVNVLIEALQGTTKVNVSIQSNMRVEKVQENIISGSKETAFNKKLENTYIMVVPGYPSDYLRFYDVTGKTSNLERIQLFNSNGNVTEVNPLYYWSRTTSAFETISMKSAALLELGREIDNLLKISNNMPALNNIDNSLGKLVDTFVDGIPQNDVTIYNKLPELLILYGKLNALETIYGIRNDIVTVSDNMTQVQNLSTNIQSIITVALEITKILNVEANLPVITNVDNNRTNINTVSTNMASVTGVADKILDVTNVSNNMNNVIAVNANKININTVSTNIDNVNTIANNIVEVLKADDYAAASAASALDAATSAQTAQSAISTLTGVKVDSTTTGAAGTQANVIYSSATNGFSFIIPKGDKGDRGDPFSVDALGTAAERVNYDTQPTGFSYLDIENSLIYFKVTDTAGDWSIGAPFGKGDKGDIGATGNGVANITFTSTTDPSGLPNKSGATDTYTILYTDGTTTTFTVYNGKDSIQIDDTAIRTDTTYSSSLIDSRMGVPELFSDGVIEGLGITTTTTSLNYSIVSGSAYIKGVRVGTDGFNGTLTPSKHTYLILGYFNTLRSVETDINVAQQDIITVSTAVDSTTYTVDINNITYSYTSNTPRAQIDTVVINSAVSGGVYAIKLNGVVYSYTATVTDTVSSIANSLATLIPNGTSDTIDTITIVASTAGVPLDTTIDATTTDNTTMTLSTLVTNISSDTTDTIASNLAAAITDTSVITSATTNVITVTAAIAGVPFIISSADVNLTISSVVANVTEGPAPVLTNEELMLYKVTSDNAGTVNISDLRVTSTTGTVKEFKVGTATLGNSAVNKDQLDAALATKEDIGGLSSLAASIIFS